MLSDATYRTLASTSVLRDFVELPSQLMEHWLSEPAVLKEHARHHQSGEPVPDDLLQRLKAAKLFNEGFNTVEYTACALLDMAVHSLEDYGDDFDLAQFEKEYLEKQGMPQGERWYCIYHSIFPSTQMILTFYPSNPNKVL